MAVAAQLAGEPGWDKGRAGRGWRGAAAFAAEGGTGILGVLRTSGAASPERTSYGGAGLEVGVFGALCSTAHAGRGIAEGCVGVRKWAPRPEWR